MGSMADFGLSDRVVIPDAIVSRDLGGEAIVLNLETGVYFSLDEVATTIWQGLQAHGTLQGAFDQALSKYEVERDVLEADLLRLVDQMASKGLLAAAPPVEG